MKRRVIRWLTLASVLIITGCSDESLHIPTESTPKILKGLSGDTYFNTRFGIKVSNLPVDEWTIKALGSEGQGLQVQQGELSRLLTYLFRLYKSYELLLMEPVPDNQFIGLDAGGYLDSVYEAGIPFILISVDCQEGGEFKTHNLADELDIYATFWSFEIVSKKAISVGKSTGLQAILSNRIVDVKQAVTWFAKGETLVRCEYITDSFQFYSYLDDYLELVENIWLMGR